MTKGWLGAVESAKEEEEGVAAEPGARGEEDDEGERRPSRRRPEKCGPEAFSIT